MHNTVMLIGRVKEISANKNIIFKNLILYVYINNKLIENECHFFSNRINKERT